MPVNGRMRIPTALITALPFDRCPSCSAERSDITRNSIVFECGMTQTMTDGNEFAVSSSCPYAMAAIQDLRAKRLARPDGMPATLTPYEPAMFGMGDKVRWVSKSANVETTKRGIIVAVVPPDARPEAYIPNGMRKNSTSGYGKSRPHITYLIKVRGKGNVVYWPRVHCLERV